MPRHVIVKSIVGVATGAVAVGGVICFLLKYSSVGVTSIVTTIAVVGLLALLVGLTATRASGLALFAGGLTLIANDALLAAKFATTLGFGHLSLSDSIGLWPASALLVVAISSAYFAAAVARRPWLLLLVVVLAVAASWPAKLSSGFFI